MEKGIKSKYFDLYKKVIFKDDKNYKDSDAINDAEISALMNLTQPDQVIIVGKIIDKRKEIKV